MIHEIEIYEGAKKHRKDRERTRQCLCKKAYHLTDIRLKSIDDITTVQIFLAIPFRAQDTCEHLPLHTVLCLYTENTTHPYGSHTEEKLTQYQRSHHYDGSHHIAFLGMGGYVYGSLYCPHHRKAHCYLQ